MERMTSSANFGALPLFRSKAFLVSASRGESLVPGLIGMTLSRDSSGGAEVGLEDEMEAEDEVDVETEERNEDAEEALLLVSSEAEGGHAGAASPPVRAEVSGVTGAGSGGSGGRGASRPPLQDAQT